MAKNTNLHTAKKEKNDEFYTRLTDIEKELVHYREHFKDKVVICNCGDAMHHNFGKYFANNFEKLGLKKLICTTFNMDGSPAKVACYYGDKNGNRIPDPDEWEITYLKGNGDFRSEEVVELLKESDIVVSNPPFSLFREYVAQIMEYGKKFLIVGNINALHYKWIFTYFQNKQLFCGITKLTDFITPENKTSKVGCRWYTNLDIKAHKQELELYRHYSNEYVHYDNLDGIDVPSVNEIPMDYDGIMGVPDSIFEYNTEGYEILGVGVGKMAASIGVTKNYRGRTDISYTINGIHKCPYSRILIRHKR